jgi:hypothetical protein
MKSEIGDETKTSNVSELETLEAIQDRVLWLSSCLIDASNSSISFWGSAPVRKNSRHA